jgi:hypothetical protein
LVHRRADRQLRRDAAQLLRPRRQREAVALDRLARQLNERGLFVIVEVKCRALSIFLGAVRRGFYVFGGC